jgi:hypothetical protein
VAQQKIHDLAFRRKGMVKYAKELNGHTTKIEFYKEGD